MGAGQELTMLSRRGLMIAGGCAVFARPALAALPVPTSRKLAFKISRNGSEIGSHALVFSQSGDALTVTVDVTMAVSFGPIRFFHYKHHTVEQWQGDVFTTLDSKTDYDGEPGFCTVRRDGDKLTVEGSKAAKYTAPGSTLAATHWNKAELLGPMINPENGMLIRPKIADLGMDRVALASGAMVPARHYSWRGAHSLDLWYDAQDDWTALKAIVKDGSELDYKKL
jgi:hypothetical protein